MKRIKYFIYFLFVCFVTGMEVRAQDVETYEGMTWYLKKSVALDSARSQGKQVFMVWGTTTCTYTKNVRKRLANLESIVADNYILWFVDAAIYNRGSAEVSDYLSVLTGTVTFPAICIIDTYDVKIAYGLKTGPQSESVLQEMLNRYVSNDYVPNNETILVKVYASGNELVVKNGIPGEIISVFTPAASLVDRFKVTDDDMVRDLSKYPEGIFIISGSSGWVRKIVVR